ncbi:MAG: uroporphyrinogen decarboxylase family protein [Promethearchaeota archaeon]
MDAITRIRKTIEHEEPDRIPSFEAGIDNIKICKYYGEDYFLESAISMQNFLHNLLFGNLKLLNRVLSRAGNSKYAAKIAVKKGARLYKKIGLDMYCTPLCLHPQKYTKEGFIDEFGRNMMYKTNPSDGMSMLYYMGGTIEDIEKYHEFPQPDPDNPLREKIYKSSKEVETDYNNDLYLVPSITGMMEVTWEGFGLENFSKLLSHPSEAKKVFDDRGQFALDMVKRIIEWGEETAVLIYDDYGYKKGLFMSPNNYQEYVIPWMRRICDTAHKGGLKVILHSCGVVYKLLDDLINAGVDAMHPFEPTTANPEYDIFKLKEKYGDKLCFIGNVSPQDLSDKDPLFIKSYTKKLIKNIAPGGGFILSSGHSINPAVKLENFLAMRETLTKYGKYPIVLE